MGLYRAIIKTCLKNDCCSRQGKEEFIQCLNGLKFEETKKKKLIQKYCRAHQSKTLYFECRIGNANIAVIPCVVSFHRMYDFVYIWNNNIEPKLYYYSNMDYKSRANYIYQFFSVREFTKNAFVFFGRENNIIYHCRFAYFPRNFTQYYRFFDEFKTNDFNFYDIIFGYCKKILKS